MERIKKALSRWVRPPAPLLAALVLASGEGLFLVFNRGWSETVLAYGLYALSAYTLAALMAAAVRFFQRGWARLRQVPVVRRYLTQPGLRLEISVSISLAVNLSYAVYKDVAGFRYRSGWFGALAFYYAVLSVERFILVRSLRQGREEPGRALRRYRSCGGLLVLTGALAAIAISAMREGRANQYPGHMIYAAAAFTFYSLGMAVVNVARFARQGELIDSAAKMVSFATALVALYSLQMSMISTFGGNGEFQLKMNGATGAVVFVLVAGMGLSMLFRRLPVIVPVPQAGPERPGPGG